MKTTELGINMGTAQAMPSMNTTPSYLEERRELDAPEVPLPHPQRKAEERYRLIAARLEAVLDRHTAEVPGGRPLGRVVIVTSPQRGDGKTTTALHVGTALSRSLGRRVAIVDADLTRPGLAPMLGLGSARGIADVLDGTAGLDEVLLRGEESGPLLVAAGAPVNGVRARGLAAIVNTLREYNDIVLIDTPALSDAADAALLGRSADGVVLVVRAGSTREDTLAAALDALVDAPLLGCVLNDHDGRSGGPRSGRPTVWEEDD
jgi:Mrp family chromosome partitioning ATPase